MNQVVTMEQIPLFSDSLQRTFEQYETKFKALADRKRLHILYELQQRGKVCVCDLQTILDMPQSKLSYHLKILLETNLIAKETIGTWNYYSLNDREINHLLSEELCCIFRPASCKCP
jgi:ArsR family transcriptional regulator